MRPKYLILMIVSALLAMFQVVEAKAEVLVGKDAPAFIVQTNDGKKFDLSEMKGKVTIIGYWATWCAPCREEMPILEALWRTYHSQGLEMVLVSVDNGSMLRNVKEVSKLFTMPIALQSSVSKNDLSPFDSVPKMFVIGLDGKVKIAREGAAQPPMVEKAFTEEIKALLDGKESKPEISAEAKPEEKK
ncbi:MAG: redoxin domain-containing protein [Alphaproteobacteria bacterium]|nr:redoxin domain-containing protein [Alphaproteobacteria bacterium]